MALPSMRGVQCSESMLVRSGQKERMTVGVIGERYNPISYLMLSQLLTSDEIQVSFFIDGSLPKRHKEKLYGKGFNYGKAVGFWIALKRRLVERLPHRLDCLDLIAKCDHKVTFIVPQNASINTGLPAKMYNEPLVDYLLVAGCDQLLKECVLRLARKKAINYHYSLLPSYRGKFPVFWQWFNREPFIGYTFHEIDLGIDTGAPLYQGCVSYDPSQPHTEAQRKVVEESSQVVVEMLRCVRAGRVRLHSEKVPESYYHSEKYHALITIDEAKTRKEVGEVIRRLGFVRLKNGLEVKELVGTGDERITGYRIDKDGIAVPVRDGYVKVRPASTKLRYRIKRLVLGKRLIEGMRPEAETRSKSASTS